MRRRYPSPEVSAPGHERWLVSYADFITLLFAFFTSMFAISNVDGDKAGRFAESMQSAFNSGAGTGVLPPGRSTLALDETAPEPATAETIAIATGEVPGAGTAPDAPAAPVVAEAAQMQHELDAQLASEGIDQKLDFREWNQELWLTLDETVLFESASADLRRDASATLRAIGKALATSPAGIRIEGHTDSQPMRGGPYASNWELSTARATALLRQLIEVEGLDPARFTAAGYGPHRPIADNDTAAGRARNRRVEIVLISGSAS